MKGKSAFLLIAIPAALLIFIYVSCWEIAYNSDFALTGLAGKWVSEGRPIPIFVWNAGYQGLLLESTLIALFFSLFGVSVHSLNLAPALLYCLLLPTWYFATRAFTGRAVALFATFLLVVSVPAFYHHVLRTQPNYVETFLFGSALTWLYARRLAGKPWYPWLAGFILGFALYSYGQILFFLGALALHAILPALRAASPQDARGTSIRLARAIAFPWGPGLRAIPGCIAVGLLGLGTFSLFTDFVSIRIAGREVRWESVAMIWDAAYLLAFLHVSRWTVSKLRAGLKCGTWRDPFAFAIGAVVGYSPKLYYAYFLGLPTRSHFGVNGNQADVLVRLKWLWEGNRKFYSLFGAGPADGWLSWLGGAVLLTLVLFAVARGFVRIWGTLSGRLGPDAHASTAPWLFLPAVVIPIFLSSNAVFDEESARYSLALIFFFSWAVADSLVFLWNARPRPAVRMACATGLALLLLQNARAFERTVAERGQPRRFEKVIRLLQSRGIHYAYGNYWYAYAITFLANESVIVQPLNWDMHPEYAARVAASPRVAYLDRLPLTFAPVPGPGGDTLTLFGQSWKVDERTAIEDVQILILSKAAGANTASQ